MAIANPRKLFVHLPVRDLKNDARQQTEGIFALSCSSRAEVDEMVKKALDANAVSVRACAGEAMCTV